MPPVKQEPMDYPPPYPMDYMDMNNYQPLPPVPPPMEEPQPKVKKRKTKQDKVTDHFKEKKPRKKIDRFKGMPEEEVAKRTLPDHLKENLDIVIVSNLVNLSKARWTNCGIPPRRLHAHVRHKRYPSHNPSQF